MNNACKSLVAAFLVSTVSLSAAADSVKVTPLGSHDGEFCAMDRALIFEDPNGTRILYDAGRTVAGADDPRLGNIDVVLVSHVHGDHVGDRHIRDVNQGSCGGPEVPVVVLPESNSVNITAAKKAKIVTGSEMPAFFASKLKSVEGNPEDSLLVRFGAERVVGGVAITTVPAVHSNGLSPSFLTGPLAEYLKAAGASLGVLNIGDPYTTGPEEAAYVVNDLITPNAVIASHANEAATQDGMVRDGTRTKQFISLSSMPVHVPLSGKTMSFDGTAHCTDGC